MKKRFDAYGVIGIIGLAKNTGKTTTLNAIINQLKNSSLGITSIGLDGESTDQIHFLPKPRIYVHEDMVVATTTLCLSQSSIDYEVIMNSKIMTALGEVLVIRVIKPGYVIVAGPTTNQELSQMIVLMKKHVKHILIDGALNRLTFSAISHIDGIVLATGASVSPHMDKTLELTRMMVELFTLKRTGKESSLRSGIWIETDKELTILKDKNVEHFSTVIASLENRINYIEFGGAITDSLLDVIINHRISHVELCGRDASRFLMSPTRYRYLKQLNITLSVKHPVKLICITLNPTRPTGESYDQRMFKEKLKEITDIDVINVMEEMDEKT